MNALGTFKTWELSALPTGNKAIGCNRYKARLVADGYNQVVGDNFSNSLSLIAKNVIVWLFLAMGTSKSWPVHQLDINTAFFHGYINKEVYMKPLMGYSLA